MKSAEFRESLDLLSAKLRKARETAYGQHLSCVPSICTFKAATSGRSSAGPGMVTRFLFRRFVVSVAS